MKKRSLPLYTVGEEIFNSVSHGVGALLAVVGASVLVTLAGIIRELSPVIEVCRWGGEEFLLAGKGNTSDPKRQLERLCRAVEAYPFEYDGVKLRLTITVGAAWFTPGESIDDWIAAADRKLYEGKSAGKNRVVM